MSSYKAAFSYILAIYRLYLSLVSIYTLSTLIFPFGAFYSPLRISVALRLNILSVLIRYIISYLSSINFALQVIIYSLYFSQISSSILQLCSVKPLYISILMSSTKLFKDNYNISLFVAFSRSIIKKRNRIRQTKGPYRISIATLNHYNSFLNSLIIVSLLYRKLIT